MKIKIILTILLVLLATSSLAWETYVAKYDTEVNLVWDKVLFDMQYVSTMGLESKLIILENGLIYILGTDSLALLDNGGWLLWQTIEDITFQYHLINENNLAYISDQDSLCIRNASGLLEWKYKYNKDRGYLDGLCVSANDNMFLLGLQFTYDSSDNAFTHYTFISLDDNGNIIWEKSILQGDSF